MTPEQESKFSYKCNRIAFELRSFRKLQIDSEIEKLRNELSELNMVVDEFSEDFSEYRRRELFYARCCVGLAAAFVLVNLFL